jgi:hypothetical protein
MVLDMGIWVQLGLTALAVLIGGLITWFYSRRYYIRASKDLEQESESLRKVVSLVLKALEEMGMEFTCDADGNFRGIVRHASVSIGVTPSTQAKGAAEQLLARATLRGELDRRERESVTKTSLDEL